MEFQGGTGGHRCVLSRSPGITLTYDDNYGAVAPARQASRSRHCRICATVRYLIRKHIETRSSRSARYSWFNGVANETPCEDLFPPRDGVISVGIVGASHAASPPQYAIAPARSDLPF